MNAPVPRNDWPIPQNEQGIFHIMASGSHAQKYCWSRFKYLPAVFWLVPFCETAQNEYTLPEEPFEQAFF